MSHTLSLFLGPVKTSSRLFLPFLGGWGFMTAYVALRCGGARAAVGIMTGTPPWRVGRWRRIVPGRPFCEAD